MPAHQTTPAPDRLIKESEFRELLGRPSRSTVWRWRREDPGFPKPRKVGPNRIGYLASEVAKWVAARETV